MADKQVHDTPMLIGIGIFTFALMCVVIWMVLSAQISSGVRWIRVGQLELISLFTDKYDVLIDQLIELRPEDIEPLYLLRMTEVTSQVLRWPIGIIFCFMTLVAFFRKPKHPYTRKMDLEAVAKEHATAFPVVSPIIRFNPLKANHRMMGSPVPEKLPLFAEALAPEEWVAFHSIPLNDGEIDRDFARRAFVKQLGGRWKGIQDLPLHAKALFVACSMKANGLRIESDEFLGRVAECWDPKRGLLLTVELRKEIRDKIADPKFGRVTEKIAAQHAFTTPALMRCLLMARDQGGVLAPAQFLWLRGVDRNLWYPLNNLGRGSVHIESAAALSHFRAEKSAGKPIPNPQIEAAIDGLMDYLRENDITTFPAKEFSRV